MFKKKDLSLEGLRGFACLSVVLAHVLFVYFPYLTSLRKPYDGAVAKTVVDYVLIHPPFRLLYAADAAVLIFMTLSGYVLVSKFHRTKDVRYLEVGALKRYIRLVLPGCASVLFAWGLLSSGAMANHFAGHLDVAGWPIHYYTQSVTLMDALINGLFLAPLFGDSSLNGPLWTLQVELLGSILLFSCYALFWRGGILLTCAWFLFFSNILAGKQAFILYYVAILAGSLLHVVAPRLRSYPFLSAVFMMLGLVGIMADHSALYAPLISLPLPDLQSLGPDFNTNGVLFWQTAGSVLLVAGVIGAARTNLIVRALSARLSVYLGRISFAVYLLHMPLIMSLAFWGLIAGRALGGGYLASAAVSLMVFMVALVILSELFTRYVDDPSIKLADRFTARLSRTRQSRCPSVPTPRGGLDDGWSGQRAAVSND